MDLGLEMENILNTFGTENISNVCRICLKTNESIDMNKYLMFPDNETKYNEILKDTFNIQLQINPVDSGPAIAVCIICQQKLNEAHKFKSQIIQNQEKLQLFLCNIKVNTMESTVKKEEPEVTRNLEVDYQFDDFQGSPGSDDDDDLKDKVGKRRSSRRLFPSCTNVNKEEKDNNTFLTEAVDSDKSGKDWVKLTERRGNGPLLRENSLKLLKNSTLCVFQWNKSRYRCFCCKEPFSDLNLLREHTNTNHTLKDIEKRIILQQNQLVKVEISTLFCKICSKSQKNLSDLKNHLLKQHGLNFGIIDEDLLVPFKLTGKLECQLCFEPFNLFRLLNIHMNKHFQKQVCHICGAGFSNLVFLNLHKSRSHRVIKCEECNTEFLNRSEKRMHEIEVHKVAVEKKMRFPCPFCQERFCQENLRVQHLVSKHGMKKPEYKCSVCVKVFITKGLCNNHIKSVHLKEKRRECDICGMRFYTKSDVTRHRVTHTGEKNFVCNFCNNLFATKDSLRRHMKRTHSGLN